MQHFHSRTTSAHKSLSKSMKLDMSTVEEEFEEFNGTQISKDSIVSPQKTQKVEPILNINNEQNLYQNQNNLDNNITGSMNFRKSINMCDLSHLSIQNPHLAHMMDEQNSMNQSITGSIQYQENESFSPLHLSQFQNLMNFGEKSCLTLSQRFSMRLNLSKELMLDPPVQGIQFGEEIQLSRRTLMFGSQIFQYFSQHLTNKRCDLFAEDTHIEEGPKFRLSQFSPDILRCRSTTSIILTNRISAQKVFSNPIGPANSPVFEGECTKSEKNIFTSFNKLQEMSNKEVQKRTFSMSVQEQYQKDKQQSFLRKRNQKISKLQVISTTASQLQNTCQSSDSEEEVENKDMTKINIYDKIMLRVAGMSKIEQENTTLPKQNKIQIIEREKSISQSQSPDLLEVISKRIPTMTQRTQILPERIQSLPNIPPILDLSGYIDEVFEKRIVKRQSQRFIVPRFSRQNTLKNQSTNLKVKSKRLVVKLKKIFCKTRVHTSIQKRTRLWQKKDDDRYLDDRLVRVGTIISFFFFLVVFMLSLAKYKIERL